MARKCPNLARMFWRRVLHEKDAIQMMTVEIHKLPIDPDVAGWLETYRQHVDEVEQLKAEKCLDPSRLDKYMGRFNWIKQCITNKYYTTESFYKFFSFNGDCPIKYQHYEYTAESYYIVAEGMPTVDF